MKSALKYDSLAELIDARHLAADATWANPAGLVIVNSARISAGKRIKLRSKSLAPALNGEERPDAVTWLTGRTDGAQEPGS